MGDVLVIGIAGGSGSGKTTLTNQIAAQLKESVTVIKHDDYYKAHDEMTYEERCRLNYDHPNAFDTELMIEHLKLLRQGRSVECPVYDYTVHNRSKDTVIINPGQVIIVEGILIFENKALCELMDIRIFVDTDADLRIIRRIQRDVMERARSLDSVISQYLHTVKPMHEQFVEPSKKNANIIVPEGGYNQVAMEMIRNHILNHLEK
ncbi:MAG: uridine kinase [Marvinbryantia sp.]|uniref:uridine kinase n=1 Tax=Marvinbryantia sp. TaxID=2496532 RepID=UPI0025D435B0|nr:uridine kinase [uncultured Marvinbryantia sp.]